MSEDSRAKAKAEGLEIDLNHEPLPPGKGALLGVGADAPDFQVTLTSGQRIQLRELVGRGPVLLNFIKGTWCPFCQKHLSTLRDWQKAMTKTNSTILVLSNEAVEVLREWLLEHPQPFLFGSVTPAMPVFKSYGVEVVGDPFARPATFLIDRNPTGQAVIRMAYDGTRGDQLRQQCESCGVLN